MARRISTMASPLPRQYSLQAVAPTPQAPFPETVPELLGSHDCVNPSYLMGINARVAFWQSALGVIAVALSCLQLLSDKAPGTLSWYFVTCPWQINGFVQIIFHLVHIARREKILSNILGRVPPGATAPQAIHIQYTVLVSSYGRTILVENVEGILSELGGMISILMFAYNMTEPVKLAWLIVIAPTLVLGFIGLAIPSSKAGRRNPVITETRTFIIFAVTVALKGDGVVDVGWLVRYRLFLQK